MFSSEQKVLIVMEGIRGELSVAELCRKYGISDSTYYKWNKEFIEAGKACLEGDMLREATSSEVQELRFQNQELKLALAELVLRYDIVKKLETLRISSQHQKYMRYTAEEKEEIIRAVKSSEVNISESLRYLGIPKRSFYNWYHKYSVGGLEALRSKPSGSPHT
ncbi:transposase [Porphyromonas sp. COT-290 OH860]|uniref:transposase n=1 Tax=Porphyromonas sp. COT-290 OH860 TaxID=1515615 RepID=UPI002100A0E7|nr:transposase [Porphyromonas sp. COT-290 OH860]